MFSFFKKKSIDINIPQWANFFDYKEYSLFIKEVDSYFNKAGIQHQISDEQVLVNEDEFGFSGLGLLNVAQVCKQEGQKHYKTIIKEHFNAMIRTNQFEKEFVKIADNFDEVKKYIGVRLYDYEYVAHVGKENTIGKDFADDIYAMVVFDFPDSVLSIRPDQTIAWGKSFEELFEIGVNNVRTKYPLIITKEGFGEFDIWFVQGEHFFTPNIVFDIENKSELIGSKGSLIGLPHRHSAIIYPIENLEVVKAINGLIPTIYGMNQEGPGSLSNNLFWYKDNTFIQLPYKFENNKLQFFPPDSFLELLNELE